MERFDWGEFKNCTFVPKYYHKPKNKCLMVYDDEGCVAVVTVNTDEVLEDDEIMVKDYSEGAGNVELLKELGIISDITEKVKSGWVEIPIYKLTKLGKSLWEENDESF